MKKFLTKKNAYIMVGLVVAMILLRLYMRPAPQTAGGSDDELNYLREFDGSLVIYTSSTCPYCIAMEPVIRKLKAMRSVAGFRVVHIVDDNAVSQRANVKGYPSVVVYKNGKTHEYSGDRTLADIKKFASRYA